MSNTKTTQRPSWKKRLLTIGFVLLNIAVILFTALSEFSDGGNAERFENVEIRYIFLLPAAGLIFLAIAIESLKYMLIMKKIHGRFRPRVCTESVLLGRYYDNVTPFGSGGQPFQIYHLTKEGFSASDSATLPLVSFLTQQYGFILIAIVALFGFGGMIESSIIRIGAYIGLGFYAFVPTLILAFTLFPRVTTYVLGGCLTLLSRLRLIKSRERTAERLFATISRYSDSMRALFRSFRMLLALLFGVLYHLSLSLIPYFVLLAFGGSTDLMTTVITTIAIHAAVTFVPTPGNAGAAETSFYQVFSSLAGGRVFWAMLVWRFLTYYLFLLFGGLVYLERFLNARRVRRAQSKQGETYAASENDSV